MVMGMKENLVSGKTLKKLYAQIRLSQEKKEVMKLENLKLHKMDVIADRLTKRIFIFWALAILTIWVFYNILGFIK